MKLKDKNVGDMAYYITTVSKNGGTCPTCPPLNCTHGHQWWSTVIFVESRVESLTLITPSLVGTVRFLN